MDDTDEPCSLSNLGEVMDNVQRKIDNFEKESKKLEQLYIHISWELPYLHEVDDGLQKTSFKVLQIRIQGTASEVKNTKFTEEETQRITDNWHSFSKEYDFKNPEVFMKSKKLWRSLPPGELLKFKQWLARGLPDRRLYSVYLKFNDIFGVESRGRWTEDEDTLLLKLKGEYDRCEGRLRFGMEKHIFLQKALGRSWMAIHRRLQTLGPDKQQRLASNQVDWSLELQGKMVHCLLKKSKLELKDLRYAKISAKVWNRVAAKIAVPVSKVKARWKFHLYPRLFARQPVLKQTIYIYLIKWFYKHGPHNWQNVCWQTLSKQMGDLGSCYLNKCFKTLVRNRVPKELHKDFKACVEHLYSSYLPELQNKCMYCAFKRLRYNKKTRTLTEIEEDEADCTSHEKSESDSE